VSSAPAAGWSVYILECRDGTLYTGITIDLPRRLQAHQRGTASRYTRARLPVRLVHEEPQPDRSSALRREAQIKKMPREWKLSLSKPPQRTIRRTK
jgi:putative endonuclease